MMTLACLALAASLHARSPITLAQDPALSPDGRTLLFSWRGDIWSAPSTGGVARALTQHPANDTAPRFSPDGARIAFLSDRQPGPQIFLMPAGGGAPRQVTAHSEGYTALAWHPDGASLLVSAARDHFWRAAGRFFKMRIEPPGAEEILFDDYGQDGDLSPDGQRLLFTREGEEWWRKGYRGSRASQVWLYDLRRGTFKQLVAETASARWPRWRPDGQGFYFVSARGGSFNLWERDLNNDAPKQLTHFEDDSVVFPCVSRDGRTIVFRHLFDLYRLQPGTGEPAARLELWDESDALRPPAERRALSQATDVAFSDDGLEVAFIAGGDLWVMDTELREPRQITRTPEEERDPVFAPDGQSVVFVSDQGGQSDLWRAQRAQPDRYWWQNDRFNLQRLTEDTDVEQNLQWSPDGARLAYVKGLGDLWTLEVDQPAKARRVLPAWNAPQYQWSPDGKWFVVARYDSDFNRDIWVLPADGSGSPVNISRHPDNESNPVWSPDGRIIAFTGRRFETEEDIYYVWLRAEDDTRTRHERTAEKAAEKMAKIRKKDSPGAAPARKDSTNTLTAATNPPPASAKPASDSKPPSETREETPARKRKLPEVVIDFDRIHDRIRQIAIPNSSEDGLVWSPDSRKLAFAATVEGKRGTYTVEFPDELKPKLLAADTGRQARWIETGNQIVWLASGAAAASAPGSEPAPIMGGVPGSLTESGKASNYTFRAYQEVDVAARHRAAFDLAWRAMRDHWYDERLGNRNWDGIRRKYIDAAASASDVNALATVINLMLGELNGSHLAFRPASPPATARAGDWTPLTPHLGLRWDPAYRGPGLKVKDVIPDGPADRKTNGILAGEIVLSIGGAAVDPALDLARVLNGPPGRELALRVRNAKGEERDVTLRPVPYASVQPLLYAKWVRDTRALVDDRSGGTLGYLHIRGMDMPSFQQFERDLYAAGSGKDGLIIDVRENGGGSTADHVLTALTQPRHAITVPRGGSPGYPQDRMVYATWHKPVVVLCNQNSFSNAEILSHAVKTLGRGKLVGVTTAGGVISTGARSIMDLGTLRMPSRGWFVPDTGEDMELYGAVPHYVVWPEPGQRARGQDPQVDKAVEVLLEDVKAWKARPQPTLRKSSQRAVAQ